MYRAIRCVRLDGRKVRLQVAHDESSVVIGEWDDMDMILELDNIERFIEGSTIMKMKMESVDFEFTWSGKRIITANASSHIEVTVAVFRHILNLFKFSEKIQLDFHLESKEVIINFPVIEGVTATALRGGPFDTSTVEAFCKKYSSQKSTALFSELSGEFSPNSPIWELEGFHVHVPGHRTSTIVENFTRRILMIHDAQFPEASIIQFMRDWMTGLAHQNLEVLRLVFDDDHSIDPLIVLEEFMNETEEWDPSKRPEIYKYDSHIIGCPNRFHCTHYLDIKRHSDGKRASFTLSPIWFAFCVWNVN